MYNNYADHSRKNIIKGINVVILPTQDAALQLLCGFVYYLLPMKIKGPILLWTKQ